MAKLSIGIHIHPTEITAVLASTQQSKFTLYDCWCIPFSKKVVQFGQPIDTETILSALKELKLLFPKKYSLRMALSAQTILQKMVTLPVNTFSVYEKTLFIQASIDKLFNVAVQSLYIDFYSIDSYHLLVTAAKKESIQQWITLFKSADLSLDVIDVLPCILKIVANYTFRSISSLLFYYEQEQWVIVSSSATSFHYHLVSDENLISVISQYPQVNHLITNKKINDTSSMIQQSSWDVPSLFFKKNQIIINNHYLIAAGLAIRGDHGIC